jgi:hypothetical protein
VPDKPIGGEIEYDLLNTLVTDEAAIASRAAEIAVGNVWGLCRCRMAAIIEAAARRMGWPVSGAEAQRRALIIAKPALRSAWTKQGGRDKGNET